MRSSQFELCVVNPLRRDCRRKKSTRIIMHSDLDFACLFGMFVSNFRRQTFLKSIRVLTFWIYLIWDLNLHLFLGRILNHMITVAATGYPDAHTGISRWHSVIPDSARQPPEKHSKTEKNRSSRQYL